MAEAENAKKNLIKKLLSGRYSFYILWALFILCMLPYYLAFFPGVFGYDTPIQVMMYFGEIPLTTHHPLAHTYLVGTFLSLGDLLFGSKLSGFIFFILFQWMLASNVLACSFFRLIKKEIKPIIVIILFVWTVVFCPAVMILSFNSTKDTLFGILFLYFSLALGDIFEAKKNDEPISLLLYVRLGGFAVLICLFRNQGIYILFALILILLIIRIKPAKLLIPLVAAFGISLCFSFFPTRVLSIQKGDIKEMLSVPIMQIAYTVNEYRTGEDISISEDDLAYVYDLLSEASFVNSDGIWDGADYFKAYFNTAVFKSNPFKFVSLYFRLGIVNLKEYFTEFHNLVSPYFSMGKCNYRGLMFDSSFEEESGIRIPIDSKFPIFRKATHFYVSRISNYFFVLEPGIGLYILLIGFILGCVKKRKAFVAILLPYILYFMTCLLGPVALLRYLYPIMLATPFLTGYLISMNKGDI